MASFSGLVLSLLPVPVLKESSTFLFNAKSVKCFRFYHKFLRFDYWHLGIKLAAIYKSNVIHHRCDKCYMFISFCATLFSIAYKNKLFIFAVLICVGFSRALDFGIVSSYGSKLPCKSKFYHDICSRPGTQNNFILLYSKKNFFL